MFFFKLPHTIWFLSKQAKKGKNIFHCTLMAPIWVQEAILLPTSECHLGISQRENGRGSNESWVIFHLANVVTEAWHPTHIRNRISRLCQTWQGVNNDSIAHNAAVIEDSCISSCRGVGDITAAIMNLTRAPCAAVQLARKRATDTEDECKSLKD